MEENNIYEYRGYQIKPNKEVPTVYVVVTTGRGGKIPDVLSGFFTTKVYAKNAIDGYLEKRETKNDETSSKSRG